MDINKIDFSKWVLWKDRNQLANIDSSGVYMLAKFEDVPNEKANPLDKNIVYIGETCNQSLKKRWYQFNRSAFQSKDGHSGGWSYNAKFKDDGKDLFVAALAVTEVNEKLRHLFIRYVERKLIFEFALKYGSQAILNKK